MNNKEFKSINWGESKGEESFEIGLAMQPVVPFISIHDKTGKCTSFHFKWSEWDNIINHMNELKNYQYTMSPKDKAKYM